MSLFLEYQQSDGGGGGYRSVLEMWLNQLKKFVFKCEAEEWREQIFVNSDSLLKSKGSWMWQALSMIVTVDLP